MPSAEELAAQLPRHARLDDLRGVSDDPSPRKTRRVKWIGQYNPMADPRVEWRILRGMYTPTQLHQIRLAAAKAVTPVQRRRIIEHNHPLAMEVAPHFNRTYVWEEANGYVVDMDYRDVDVLMSSEVAHEFVDLDDPHGRPAWSYTSVPETKLGEERVGAIDVEVGQLIAVTGSGHVSRTREERGDRAGPDAVLQLFSKR